MLRKYIGFALLFTGVFRMVEGSPFKEIPKVELHLHLGGSYPVEYLHTLASEEQKARLTENLQWISGKVDYHAAFKVFDLISELVNTEEKAEAGIEALCRWLHEDGVVYAEIRTGLANLGKGRDAHLQALLRGMQKSGLAARLLLSLRRNTSIANAREIVDLALKYRSEGVVGIDISGDSTIGDITPILSEIQCAKKAGLCITLHIGESPKETGQLELLMQVEPHRVGHAVYLSEDAYTWIVEKGIPIEACLTSSYCVGMTENPCDHPGLKLYSQGHPIALCTDDPMIFQISLADEFARLVEIGWEMQQIRSLAMQAIDHAFLSEEEKASLKSFFDR